uniref:Uncharacterized protein n=1 Tax=Rhizophora mucronata TaxID=61149 RepID=A0A2P2P1D9_RHIMU
MFLSISYEYILLWWVFFLFVNT